MQPVSPMRSTHILIVDSDVRARASLESRLACEGFRVSQAESGARMRAALARDDVDLVLLEVALPGEDGLRLAQEIRARDGVGLIMLTSRATLLDRVIGLEVGADDYVAKPFHPRELLARMRSVLRRLKAPERSQPLLACVIHFDGWRFDRERRELTDPRGRPVLLTTGEFNLLSVLIAHAGQVLSRDQLMDMTRGRSWEAYDRTIDAQVARLRKKIEIDSKRPRVIQSVRGTGYVFTATSISSAAPAGAVAPMPDRNGFTADADLGLNI